MKKSLWIALSLSVSLDCRRAAPPDTTDAPAQTPVETSASQPVAPAVLNPARNAKPPFNLQPQPTAARRRAVDSFDSHTFWDAHNPAGRPVTLTYSSKHASQGSNALQVYMPISDEPANWYHNMVTFRAWLPEPEDWSGYPLMTVDLYSEEQPTTLPGCRLVLRNSIGEEFELNLVLNWLLFRWENLHMTFPLRGNAYDAPIPPNILNDIVYVEMRIYHVADGQFGPPVSDLKFHVDNMQLSGIEPWDTFEGPGLDWHNSGDRGTRAGITHNVTHNGSAGSLALRWNYAPGIDRVSHADATTRLLDQQDSSSLPFAPLDLSGMRTLNASVRGEKTEPELRVRMFDGANEYVSPPRSVSSRDSWQDLSWPLPASDFDLSHVVALTFEVPDIPLHPTGAFYIDDLSATGGDGLVDGMVARAGRHENYLAWRPSAASIGSTVIVRAAKDAYPLYPTQGDDVCVVGNVAPLTTCVHGGLEPGATYYYSLFVGDEPTALHLSASQDFILLGAPDTSFEAAFDKRNGALVYVYDRSTERVVSYGTDATWAIVFFDELALPSLDSASFSATSATRSFSYSEGELRYDFNEDGRRLTVWLTLTERADGFSIRTRIDNQTGVPIRTVKLPHDISFVTERVKQVLWPVQEGLLLLKPFFASGRSSNMARPPMFADVIALDSYDGALALYAVQDSHYQADLITGHAATEPVFQPNNLYVAGGAELSKMGFEQVTYIPSGATWSSVDMRFSIGKTLREVAAAYRRDNGFDDSTRYPTLAQKLKPFGIFDRLAKSPIYVVEAFKMILWQKASYPTAPGLPTNHPNSVWTTVRTEWLPVLPAPSVFHIIHWQYGRDDNSDPDRNHRIEDDHPDTLPVWWDKYGTEPELQALITDIHTRGSLVMPFTNWSVWNKVDPINHQLPALASTPAATRTLRGESYPHIEYDGYMVKPWRPEVRMVDDAMATTYRTTYPMDLLFVDMTGERTWRYVLADDNVTATAAAYTQGVVEENRRLSARIPLFTEGVFDRIADSVTGYNQTLRQKRWNGVLDHIGTEFVDWVPYPFAADIVHKNVAFYQHDLNTETWPAKGTALYSYYVLMGYNLLVNATAHFGEDHYWMEVGDAMAKAVTSRTFGQPLLDYRILNARYSQLESVWGPTTNPFTVSAFFDPLHEQALATVDGYSITPDGFFARSAKGDVVAGVFEGLFNHTALVPGTHWITVVRQGNQIEVRHPLGDNDTLSIPRPSDWASVDTVQFSVILQDGSEQPRGTLIAVGDTFPVPTEQLDTIAQRWVRGYRLTRP